MGTVTRGKYLCSPAGSQPPYPARDNTSWQNMVKEGRFFPGRTLDGELKAAMERVATCGITCPPGYYKFLLAKYREAGVRYPHLLMILGKPRINSHFFYREAPMWRPSDPRRRWVRIASPLPARATPHPRRRRGCGLGPVIAVGHGTGRLRG